MRRSSSSATHPAASSVRYSSRTTVSVAPFASRDEAATTSAANIVVPRARHEGFKPRAYPKPSGTERIGDDYGLPTKVVTDCAASDAEKRAPETETGLPAASLELVVVTNGVTDAGHAVPATKNETF